MTYFNRLKDIREDNDLSQKEIAKLLQTTFQQISKYENGIQMMGIDKYIKLAKYYNISIDYLVGIISTPKPLNDKNTITEKRLTQKQQKLLKEYAAHPEHQNTIDKILDI